MVSLFANWHNLCSRESEGRAGHGKRQKKNILISRSQSCDTVLSVHSFLRQLCSLDFPRLPVQILPQVQASASAWVVKVMVSSSASRIFQAMSQMMIMGTGIRGVTITAIRLLDQVFIEVRPILRIMVFTEAQAPITDQVLARVITTDLALQAPAITTEVPALAPDIIIGDQAL